MPAEPERRGLWTALLSVLPVAGEPALGAAGRCALGEHTWLDPEASLRSARTGYRLAFCRCCAASRPTASGRAPRPAPRFGHVGVPVPG